MFNWGYDHNNYVFPPQALVGTVIQYTQECQAKLTLVSLEWYSRSYMNILFPQTSNPFLIDKVYLGYSLDILEYNTQWMFSLMNIIYQKDMYGHYN